MAKLSLEVGGVESSSADIAEMDETSFEEVVRKAAGNLGVRDTTAPIDRILSYVVGELLHFLESNARAYSTAQIQKESLDTAPGFKDLSNDPVVVKQGPLLPERVVPEPIF